MDSGGFRSQTARLVPAARWLAGCWLGPVLLLDTDAKRGRGTVATGTVVDGREPHSSGLLLSLACHAQSSSSSLQWALTPSAAAAAASAGPGAETGVAAGSGVGAGAGARAQLREKRFAEASDSGGGGDGPPHPWPRSSSLEAGV